MSKKEKIQENVEKSTSNAEVSKTNGKGSKAIKILVLLATACLIAFGFDNWSFLLDLLYIV